MDDPRTQETLDALADLFLTPPLNHPAPPSPRQPIPGAKPAAPRTPPPPRSKITPANTARFLADPPAGPVRLAPKVRPQPFTSKPFLSIADPSDDSASPTPVHRPLRVEAVFLGNLPGFSGPWLTQYAYYLAQRIGPVLILHVDEDQFELEMVNPLDRKPNEPLTESTPTHSPLRLVSDELDENELLDSSTNNLPPAANHSLLDDLQQLLNPLRTSKRDTLNPKPYTLHPACLLIHLPDAANPRLVKKAFDLPAWTVVCGAFDAAVASACQTLNQLLHSDARPAGATPPSSVGVMVMGSDEARSLAATAKLSIAAQTLGIPIDLRGWLRQMVPINLRVIGSYPLPSTPAGETHWAKLRILIDELAQDSQPNPLPPPMSAATQKPSPRPAPAAPFKSQTPPAAPVRPAMQQSPSIKASLAGARTIPGPAPTPIPTSHFTAADYRRALGLEKDPTLDTPVLESKPTTTNKPAVRPPSVITAAPRPRPARPETPVHPQPAPTSPAPSTVFVSPPAAPITALTANTSSIKNQQSEITDSPDLSTFLPALAGVPLQARCPTHPRTQILLDQQGRLHLLRQHSSNPPTTARAHTPNPTPDTRLTTHDSLSSDLRSAIVDLFEARTWAASHLPLLALTQRQLRFDPDAAPILHLFTDQAKTAAALVGKLEDAVKLHLLHQVRVADKSTWFCTELN